MFGKIINLLTTKRKSSYSGRAGGRNVKKWFKNEGLEHLFSGIVGVGLCVLIFFNWNSFVKDGFPGLELDFEDVVIIAEANQDTFIDHFTDKNGGFGNIKLCYRNNFRKDTYCIRDDDKLILFGYSLNWHFRYNVSKKDFINHYTEFNQCKKLNL